VSSKLPDPFKDPHTVLPTEPEPDSPSTPLSKAEKKAAKRARKEAKRQRNNHRALDAWERYRALTDAFDMQQELVDLADHKARFALIIMGALNAVFVLGGLRGDVQSMLPDTLRPWVVGYLVVYACVAVHFFLQAIESLRPREGRPHVPDPGDDGYEDHPLGVRFFEDVLRRDITSYQQAWRDIHIGQLNAELTVQVHVLARINHAKYAALRKLYGGLRVMTLLLAGLLTTIAMAMVPAMYDDPSAMPMPKGKKHHAASGPVLPTPVRFADIGVQEPSGITYHPKLGHLFLVGDEGSLSELDEQGHLLRTETMKGNLEDVAVHGPSGQLVMISEKKSALILYDPVARRETRRWKLDHAALLGQPVGGDRNAGFEGLAFKEEPGRPGGGIFYLVNQRAPEMVVAVTFDLESPSGPLEPEVIGRWPIAEKNVKAAAYVPTLDRLLVLSAKRGVVVLSPDGKVERELALPKGQHEGMCLDGAGNLWVADDQGKSVWRFDGALATIRASLGEAPPG
jgi:uncharacterized protein YjiK